MIYALCYNLTGEAYKYHQKLTKKIADKFGVIKPIQQNLKPHITLKYSFEAEQIHELEKLLEKFCQKAPKAEIQIGGFNSFKQSVIFQNILFSPKAQKVFSNLIQELHKFPWITWRDNEGEKLHFHATLADDCQKQFPNIQNFLKNKEQYFSIYFDNIQIIKLREIKEGIKIWDNYKTYYFKNIS